MGRSSRRGLHGVESLAGFGGGGTPFKGPKIGFRPESVITDGTSFPNTTAKKALYKSTFHYSMQRPRNGGIVLGGSAQVETSTTPLSSYANIAQLDAIVAALKASDTMHDGGDLAMSMYAPPNWASGATNADTANRCPILPTMLNAYADLCGQAVARWGLNYFDCWNEGKGYSVRNSPSTISGTSLTSGSYDEFVTMRDTVYDAVKSYRSVCKLGAPYIPTNTSVLLVNGAVVNSGTTAGFKKMTSTTYEASGVSSGVFEDNVCTVGGVTYGWCVDAYLLDMSAHYYKNTTKYDYVSFDTRLGATWKTGEQTPITTMSPPTGVTFSGPGSFVNSYGTACLDDLNKFGLSVDWHRNHAKAGVPIWCKEMYIKDGIKNPNAATDVARVLADGKAHQCDVVMFWGDPNTPDLTLTPYTAGGVETAWGAVMRAHTSLL